ncbi:aminotransferase class I/II-fold pyridoxal phosphate-dependent enzyme [Frankia sp. AgB32]|uniref:aminotransferase class I/II-fold pyridoxal phosphate-dependent enzyme n=1 Tax=Frankia sp. AgB32 TaxID=631119 RepID=UPI00200DE271|nr:aminotransferase class I/II-fold pyridoxal phosphate-dependent enzyme [Frankia sp. AgB32]MCK9893959.1 aminotransferase class I/II-fold pyridoxal phosphate-dependent enzyme [Frankia sp. AgB32]
MDTTPTWRPAERVRGFTNSVFSEMTSLAMRTGAINLGQGIPEAASPVNLLRYATDAISTGENQYAPASGLPRLRDAIAQQRFSRYLTSYQPSDEVVVTTGATEAIAAAVLAFCGPGDQIITFDPCYDSYPAVASLAGAQLVAVPLRQDGDGFALDVAALRRAARSARSRLLILNTPHNPTGKVFTTAEIAAVADICLSHDLIVVTDEVYEYLTYDGREHQSIAALPGMMERTVAISSAGKTFNVTGWKVGWACGPAHLVGPLLAAKQFLSFSSGTPFQVAVAAALLSPETRDPWLDGLRSSLQRRRDILRDGLERAGLKTFRAEGGYFLQADVRGWGYDDDLQFCQELPRQAGVVAIPVSAFYQNAESAPRWLARFAFCKRDDVLSTAVEKLASAAPGSSSRTRTRTRTSDTPKQPDYRTIDNR